jgi:putative ABC transport system substrate-binding protein
MKRKITVLALCAVLFALGSSAEAQQTAKIPRIGYLTADPLSAISANRDAFRQGLRELGYVEGKNLVIEWRVSEGKPDHELALASELVRLKVDVIVGGGSLSIRAARQATAIIPIVMVNGGDAVGSGFVASLARPGGNITGLASLRPELSKATGASEGDCS